MRLFLTADFALRWKTQYFLTVVVHLNLIAFSSLFFAIQLALFPDISIIACGKVPAILGKRYAKGCEKKYGEVIKSLITFLFCLLSLCLGRGGDVVRPQVGQVLGVPVWRGSSCSKESP